MLSACRQTIARRRTPRLANPLSEEQPYLRGSLLPGLLAVARRNTGRGATDLALFELGTVFLGEVAAEAPVRPPVHRRPSDAEWRGLNELLPHQPTHVAAVLTGNREPQGWWGPARPATWSDAIEAARIVARDLRSRPRGRRPVTIRRSIPVGALDCRSTVPSSGSPASCTRASSSPAACRTGRRPCGSTSTPSSRAPRTCARRLRVGTQPQAKEDLAVVVDRSVPVADVQAALAAGAGDLLESVRLFDVYEGPQVPEGKKSLAFALRFRAPDRTLDAAETAGAREARPRGRGGAVRRHPPLTRRHVERHGRCMRVCVYCSHDQGIGRRRIRLRGRGAAAADRRAPRHRAGRARCGRPGRGAAGGGAPEPRRARRPDARRDRSRHPRRRRHRVPRPAARGVGRAGRAACRRTCRSSTWAPTSGCATPAAWDRVLRRRARGHLDLRAAGAPGTACRDPRSRRRVANPGCYATSVALALAPVLAAGLAEHPTTSWSSPPPARRVPAASRRTRCSPRR